MTDKISIKVNCLYDIKKYIHSILIPGSNNDTFLKSKKISISFRKSYMNNKNNFKLNKSITDEEMKLFFLTPIIFRFGKKKWIYPTITSIMPKKLLLIF